MKNRKYFKLQLQFCIMFTSFCCRFNKVKKYQINKYKFESRATTEQQRNFGESRTPKFKNLIISFHTKRALLFCYCTKLKSVIFSHSGNFFAFQLKISFHSFHFCCVMLCSFTIQQQSIK